ncbi:ATP synthase subunit I [Methylonatrum kenyense]|uniref:ATP synthase subunit I n=1 Tax=Methylonatrum kenyense TaxID=455253 RepID=UPI0020BE253D|nr:ATP synthase subunit I [Methylonatrum kenyense]MCK8515248.1 ATP synthase subunit I [Methylonatrum kenyense]
MPARSPVRFVFFGQLVVAGTCALLWLLLQGPEHGAAALVGGLIAIIPGAYLAMKVFSVRPDAPPKQIIGAFYKGEALKFGLTVVLFIVALQWFADHFAPLIVTYILTILVFWVAFRVGAAEPAVRQR